MNIPTHIDRMQWEDQIVVLTGLHWYQYISNPTKPSYDLQKKDMKALIVMCKMSGIEAINSGPASPAGASRGPAAGGAKPSPPNAHIKASPGDCAVRT